MRVYNLIRILLYIIIFCISIFNKKCRNFYAKRLIKNSFNKSDEERILIHMSSVGEFNLSKAFIDKLLEKEKKIILSIVTDTGYAIATENYGQNKNVEVIYFPLDDYFLLNKLYKNNKIIKTIVVETEIWPNLYNIASKKSSLYIVNGRLTEKKMYYYMKYKWIIKKILNKAKKIMVQSHEDAERYLRIGVKDSKIICYKNMKYSIKYDTISETEKKEYYKNHIYAEKNIIVCGSTHEGEEKIWLNVFEKLNRAKYQLILVPRHTKRLAKIENTIKKSRLDYAKFTENRKADIIVVDKMGVLRDLYQLATYAFVGGTLVDVGGHSILEPLYYGKLPIIGKYYQNIEDIVSDAQKLNYIKIVESEDEIFNYLLEDKKINTANFFNKNNDLEKIINEII